MSDEKEFFCECIRQHEKSIHSLAYGILKNEEDAADIMQEAILKAYCNMDNLRDKKKFKPWILSIVHNTAIEFLRKHRETVDIEDQWGVSAPEPPIDTATKLTVWEAVQRLKLPYRTVVILFYYDNLPIQKISDITSTPAVTVRQQLFRARKMLAGLLNKEDFTQ